MICASVLPIVEPTSAFANPALSGLPIPRFLYRLSYSFAKMSVRLLSKPISAFRSKFDLPANFRVPAVQHLYGISPAFLPVPKDFADQSAFTGFWFGRSTTELSDDVVQFLEAGEPPLLLTFGSMPFNASFDLQDALLEMVKHLGIRLIIMKGWGLDQVEKLAHEPRIKVIGAAPHEKLFPYTKAIIHHGGIGTTAACLQAGKPFMICPVLYPIGDQLFWGEWSHRQGLAVRPVPLSRMTANTFLALVQQLLTDEALYAAAAKMKAQIDQENGLDNAIRKIEAFHRHVHAQE